MLQSAACIEIILQTMKIKYAIFPLLFFPLFPVKIKFMGSFSVHDEMENNVIFFSKKKCDSITIRHYGASYKQSF